MASWLFNVSDTSPIIQYQPFGDGPLESGWQVGYTESGLDPTADGQVGSGDSYHTTMSVDSNLTLSFFGTGIILLGNANCSYSVSVGGSPVGIGSPPSGTLFSETSLQSSFYTVVLSPQPASEGQGLNFTGAQLISSAASESSSTEIDNQDVTRVAYQGTWFNNTNPQIPNATDPQQFFQTNQSNASASLNFQGYAVSVNGESNDGFGVYQVQLDTSTSTMNASSRWLIPNALLFFTNGLDETQTHTLKLTNMNSGQNFALNTITVFKSQDSTSTSPQSSPSATGSDHISSHHSLSGGAAAGIAIGALASLLVFALFLLYFLRRRRRRARPDLTRHSPTIEPYQESLGYGASNPAAVQMGEVNRGLSPDDTTNIDGKITAHSSDAIASMAAHATMASSSRTEVANVLTHQPESISNPSTSHRRDLSPSVVPEDVTDNADESVFGRTSRSGRSQGTSPQRGRATSISTNSGRSSNVDRLVDVVAGRLLQRLGGSHPEEDESPPSYSFHEPQ